MTCGTCAARVEKTLTRQPGVARAAVNFATGRAVVAYDPRAVPDGMPPVRHRFCQAARRSPIRTRAPGSAESGSSAELGELAVDFGEVERLGFLRVLLGWVLDRGVALVRHAGWVRLVRVEREGLLRRDLVLPACPEVVLVPNL